MLEDNVRDFAGNWYGSGTISGSGDAEQICLEAGEYMISEIVETGDQIIQLLQNNYAAGDDVNMYYRTGATPEACFSAIWTTYSTPFTSLGYVQVKLESTVGNLELGVSANGRYLVNGANEPFLLVGDSPQGMMVSLTVANMDVYLSNRSGYGVNAIQVMLVGDSTYTGGNDTTFATVDGVKPFSTNGDLSTVNNAYFARVETMLDMAASYGMVVMLNIDVYSANERALYKNNGVTKCGDYGEYLGNRFKNYPNIIWCYGCDYQPTTDTDLDDCLYAIRDGIASQDTNHIHTMWSYIGWSSRLVPAWDSRVNIDFLYTYSAPYGEVYTDYLLNPAKPIFLGESNYEDASGSTPLRMRRQAYMSMLFGAYGHFYCTGAYIWRFDTGWASYLDSYPGLQDVITHLKALLTGKAWYSLVPDYAHAVLTAGYGTYQVGANVDSNDYAVCGYVASSLALIYMPTNRTMTVDMSKFSGTVTCRWFDPTSGQYETDAASPHANTGTHDFSHAGTNDASDPDWILVLEA